MSQESVEIVRRLYESWISGEYFSVLDVWDSEIEFVVDETGGIDLATTTHGIEAMGRLWGRQLEAWQDFKVDKVEEIFDAGDQVVALVRLRGRGRHSGVEVTNADRGAVFTFRHGKVIRLLLTRGEKALEAVGLSE